MELLGRKKFSFTLQGFFFFLIYFIYLFLAALGLHCCARALCSRGNLGPLFIVVHGPPIAAVPPAAEHGLQAHGPQQLWHAGSAVVAHGPSCSATCGIFPDQGPNPRPCTGKRTPNHCATREAPTLQVSSGWSKN